MDALGIDSLTGCESAIFPPPPGSGGAGGVAGGPGQPSPAAFGARTLITLRLARNRIPARGPLAVRVSNRNAFDVTGTLAGQRKRTKLRAKSFTVAASTGKTVRLRLPKALRRQLARQRTLALRLTANVRDPAGNTRTIRKTVRPPRGQAAERLGLAEAHRVARIVAQRHFAEVFDARARVGRCTRVALNRAVCPVFVRGPGVRCSLTVFVKETKNTWRLRARALRC